MYFKKPVQIPDEKGKIVFRTKGGSRYVLYEIDRVYKPERKYTIPKRKVIGKVIDGKDGWMYPNELFQSLFPNTEIPPSDDELPLRSCALSVGSYLVLCNVIQEYELRELLTPHFGEYTGLLLDLASYLIVTEGNAAQYYPDYAFHHPLFTPGMRTRSDATVSRFFSNISRDQTFGFLDAWNEKQGKQERIYVAYDSTNKNCQAGDVEIAEFGKAKHDIGEPIINFAVAYNQTNQIPLLYEDYPGSVNDVSQLKYLIDKMKEYNFKSLGFVIDRGYFSRSNLEYMDLNGYHYVLMVKGRKQLVSSLILSKWGQFEHSLKCFIDDYQIYGTTIATKIFDPSDPKEKQRWCHIFFSSLKMAKERDKFQQELLACKHELAMLEGEVTDLPDTYRKYFNCTFEKVDAKQRRFLYATEKHDVIEQELKLCGYFCIVTSEKMSAAQAYTLYAGRDCSEKLFRADKTFLGSSSMRVHSTQSVQAKLFVEFIALIIRNRIYNLLKEELLRTRTRNKHLTVPAALKELDKMELVRMPSGKYRLHHAITKNQRTILSAFGISESDAIKQCNAISNLLQSGEMTAFDEYEIEEENDEIKEDNDATS